MNLIKTLDENYKISVAEDGTYILSETYNNTSTSVINLDVNVDLLYYSYDDVKWKRYYKDVNSGRFDITLPQNSKVRLKAVNTLENTTTFDINNYLHLEA